MKMYQNLNKSIGYNGFSGDVDNSQNGILLKYFKSKRISKTIILSTILLCHCFYAISQEIYVTGSFSKDSYRRSSVFHNNTRLYDPIGDGLVVTVSENNDIYVAGSKWTTAQKAMVWKNGSELYNLTNDNGNTNRQGSANSIVLNMNDVWVTGYEQNNSNKKVAKVWKNGVQEYVLTNGDYDAEGHSIVIDGNNVYVAGYEINSSGKKVAKIWKNGTLHYSLSSSSKNAEAMSIFIENNVIYISGYEENSNSTPIAKVWKNNSSWYELATRRSYARSIIVSNGNIYVAGEVDKPSTLNIADIKVWLNGNELYTLNQNDYYGRGRSLAILDNDIYVTGYEKSSGNTTQFSRVWKNGNVLYTLSNATNEDGPHSIFVKSPITVPVTNIANVPTSVTAGTPLSLIGSVIPSNATNQNINWSVANAGGTGATITGNNLNTIATGVVQIRATIIDGIAVGTNYTQDFNITVNANVNIIEIMRDNSYIKIYPNPSLNSFFIDCVNSDEIKLYDISGKEVLSQNVNDKTEINIEHLPKGIYHVRVFSRSKIVGKSKFVKQ